MSARLSFLYFFILLFQLVGGAWFGELNAGPKNCDHDIRNLEIWKDLTNFEKTTIQIQDFSSHGGEVNIYREKNQIKALQAIIYGETGKSQIYFYPYDEGLNTYFVNAVDFYYSSSIYMDAEPKTVSTITYKFVVCDNIDIAFPGVSRLSHQLERARSILKKVIDIVEKS